jgi:hypothetical protein
MEDIRWAHTVAIVENAVRNGIALLDREVPHWRGLIDWDQLDMTSSHDCILGQIFHDDAAGNSSSFYSGYDYACEKFDMQPCHCCEVGREHIAADYGFTIREQYGFETSEPEVSWETLGEMWESLARYDHEHSGINCETCSDRYAWSRQDN